MGWLDWFRRKPTVEEEGAPDEPDDAIDPEQPQLTEELDLHNFQPRDCADLVEEYVHAAHAAGFARVRIIHGKGKGTLRRTVHAVLDRHPLVRGYRLGDQRSGSWGATLVELGPKP
jgi:dsDNA-specific endonuclease/ATPase MutS2